MAVGLAAVVGGALSCGSDSDQDAAQPATGEVSGLILDLDARSLLELESVTLEDENGATWIFEAQGKRLAGFTPSHLREHMLLGEPVTVAFHRENGVLVLDDVTD